MPRADLRGLIGNLGEAHTAPAESPVAGDPVTRAKASDAASPVANEAAPKAAAATKVPASGTDPASTVVPHFLEFERKETRLRADQQNALTQLARSLNRAKGVGGWRITDNTLIRVAIDLLLSKQSALMGQDEASLRRSVGVKVDRS